MICDSTPVCLDIRRLWLAGMTSLRVDGVRVEIVTTPCTYGGVRRWFLCPRCERRCAVLYKGLRCRICIRGRYSIELLSPLDRMIIKARKLRRKLGQDDPSPIRPIPEKPHRMRWHTYMRIRSKIVRLESEVLLMLNERMKRRK